MTKLEETNATIETITELVKEGVEINAIGVFLADIAKSLSIIADYCLKRGEQK